MTMKNLDVIEVEPPPSEKRFKRLARPVKDGQRKSRYSLPSGLKSNSPVGYRTRLSLTEAQAVEAMALLSMARPTAFQPPSAVQEHSLFEEVSLGILSSRQSTNFRGFKQVTFGPDDAAEIRGLLSQLNGTESEPLANASHVHLVLGRPYRTPFTMLLTLVGHRAIMSPLSVAHRILRKWVYFEDDIPSIGYLAHLHVGILAEAMERAAVLASDGRRRALTLMAPFCGRFRDENAATIRRLENLCGLTTRDRLSGWQLCVATQVGEAMPQERIPISRETARRVAANLLAFRSERIQPGVNQEDKAPPEYQVRQDMDVSDAFTEMTGRALYNGFCYWTGLERTAAKNLLLMDRVDVLTPDGKARLRAIRGANNAITDRLIKEMPAWADLPTGRAFSRNAERGRKAFALAGQRIYIGGLSKDEVAHADLDWASAIRAVGAAASRSTLYCELMGVVNLPQDCDLLAGICMMAGPVNQNDIGKTFYGMPDLLSHNLADRDPTSLLVWTLKAKTVADPIGNEEQLLNAARKGALVDLRPGPHEVITIKQGAHLVPMRDHNGQLNEERAFSDQDNFVRAPDGSEIPGNNGNPWPDRAEPVWP